VSRRVVITGIGLVSSLGIGTSANWAALLAGTSGVGRITKFDTEGFAAQIAAEVKGFDPLQFVDRKDVKKMDVFIQYAVAASQFAVDDAKVKDAVAGLAREILSIQARGDRAAAVALLDSLAVVRPEVKRVLDRLGGVPVDIAPRFVTAEALTR